MKFISRRPSERNEPVPPWPQNAGVVRVLLIDDDEDEFELLRGTFADIRGTQYELAWVSSYSEGRQAISEDRFHAYLIDYRLGASSGVDLVREVRSAGSEAPLIILTGQGSRTVDLEAMEAGATDFLEKGKTAAGLLERTIRYAITQAATTAALRRALTQISGIESLGRLLAQEGPSPDALEQTMALVIEGFGVPAAALYLAEGDHLVLAAVQGYDQPAPSIDPRGGRLARVIESGRGQVIPNVTLDPSHRSEDARLELALPLFAEGRCLGLLNVAWSEDASADDDRGLRLIADRLAVALALNRAIRGRTLV